MAKEVIQSKDREVKVVKLTRSVLKTFKVGGTTVCEITHLS